MEVGKELHTENVFVSMDDRMSIAQPEMCMSKKK